jgi:hypothetical protein
LSKFIDFLYGAPVWELGLTVCAIVVGGTLIALFTINALWKKELRRSHNEIAGFLIAVVGIIFAVMISALTLSVMTRQDQANSLAMQEAQVLQAMTRDIPEMSPDDAQRLQRDLRGYLSTVIDGEWPQMRAAQWPDAAETTLGKISDDVIHLPLRDAEQTIVSQDLRRHLDRLYELRLSRGNLSTTGVDRTVWYVVLLGAISTIFFAVLFGVENFFAHVLMTCLLAFTTALAITMIIAIDWPYFGEDSISPDALIVLRRTPSFSGAAPAASVQADPAGTR